MFLLFDPEPGGPRARGREGGGKIRLLPPQISLETYTRHQAREVGRGSSDSERDGIHGGPFAVELASFVLFSPSFYSTEETGEESRFA